MWCGLGLMRPHMTDAKGGHNKEKRISYLVMGPVRTVSSLENFSRRGN